MLRKSINEHILKNNTHQNSINTEDLENHNKLIQILSSGKEKNVKSKKKTGVEYKEEAITYLDFLIFVLNRDSLLKKHRQLENIKTQSKENPDALFSLNGFDSEEELSKIVRLLSKHIMEEVRDDLAKSDDWTEIFRG